MVEEWWEFCPERRLCVGNTYFKHRSSHKYKKVAMDKDGVEVKGIIDLVLVKKIWCTMCRSEGSERNGTRPLRSPCGTV